ncbi:MAG: T9SS type A sorting domain-containing protein [Candidatus Cloacimonetes bacterium]|nr:T9SS type A sorting domain-containing protein [Candidatus Cloacimonadota bacterium]
MRKMLFLLFLIFSVGLLAQTPVSIYDIQYTEVPGPDNTYPSPYDGQVIITTGIVTAVGFSGYPDNFFISMPEGGAWKGLYIYDAEDTTLVVGDIVEVTGEVSEYWGFTEIAFPTSVTLLSSGNPVPDPVVVTCANLQPEGVGEPYESVLIELHDLTVVEEQISYGQWYVTDGTGISQMDDGFFYLDNVQPPIVITVGDTWAILRGILDYGFDEYGLNPRTPDDMIAEVSTPENTVELTCQFIGCYLNPFNPQTIAQFSLNEASFVNLTVYNVKGQKVRTLVNELKDKGVHSVVWNGKDDSGKISSSGIYLFDFEAANGDYTSVRKVILLK